MTDSMGGPIPAGGPGGGRVDVESASVGELMGNVSRDLLTLLRQEIVLAKAEIRAEARRAGRAAGMLGIAGFAGYMLLLFLSLALWWGLANVMDQGWAALIVAALWAVLGIAVYAVGRNELRAVNATPERTVETAKQIPQALKPHEEKP
ncbi:MAG TPA: phage holin family protein [Actinophytocola sp.]|uniref:phage holin family protein n=1 Tax=Actinophytocola sp. TaxID=1872138 RepID=UPI002DDD97CD|nr:phage holin family protein [Actinophytocola sp.]HEV2782737.1 phage holin family protein [Actinophytocola sp.]